ncbi:MAG: SDR family oxidoreductase [Planctomycetes bacterium]|nr:SDR family oxidoreductase [Planctomycetota bacterium]
MTEPLEGRRCVVTGGGSGIGRAIAIELVKAGATVALTGRRLEPLQETVTLCHGKGAAHVCDVSDAGQVDDTFEMMTDQFGGIDVLVNNAGVGGPNACSGDGEDRWDAIIRTNLDGVFFCSRAALAHMPDGGRVINISSVLGQFGVPGYTAYCASKHGVIGFTKALALEVAPRGITVNAICPGWVDTDMARAGMEDMAKNMGVSFEEARKIAMNGVPLGRILQPAEIGRLVVYLASDDASGMTAQAVSLCGGQVMNG